MPSVLIVDDDLSSYEALRVIFEEYRFRVDEAHSGAEALAKTKERYYNMALIDAGLPDTGGFELLGALGNTAPEMVKIIVTDNATLESAIEALNGDADGYIQKPIDVTQLLGIVRRKLEAQAESQRMTDEKVAEYINERIRALKSEQWGGLT